MSKRFYITTAIDYVNGQPHLGHAYEKVIADVIARAHRSLGQETFFLTGLDEHGQKVQQAAVAEGKSPQAYCDDLAAIWKAFAAKLELTNDDFVRTTEPRHKEVVQAILAKLHAEGHFYKEVYRGFYSTREETFLTQKDRRPDGTFDPAYGEVVELDEENYYFRLKDHQQWLIDYIEQNPSFVAPSARRNEVLGLPQEQCAGGLVHQPARFALELGHSAAVRSRLRHLRLVRRAVQLHHHPRSSRRSRRPRALRPQPSTLNPQLHCGLPTSTSLARTL
jgi:methionyl-tRNA synthetase